MSDPFCPWCNGTGFEKRGLSFANPDANQPVFCRRCERERIEALRCRPEAKIEEDIKKAKEKRWNDK